MRATLVLRLAIDEASAKIRTGPPVDDDEDYALPFGRGSCPSPCGPQSLGRTPGSAGNTATLPRSAPPWDGFRLLR